MINQINVGIIGTGWCGGIRANACSENPLVDKLYIAETNTKRLIELKETLEIEQATENWKELINLIENYPRLGLFTLGDSKSGAPCEPKTLSLHTLVLLRSTGGESREG